MQPQTSSDSEGVKNDRTIQQRVKNDRTTGVDGLGLPHMVPFAEVRLSRNHAATAREIQMARETRSSRFGSPGTGGLGPGVRSVQKAFFRKEGEYWTVGFGGKAFRLKDTKGLGYVAHLLRHPGAEFHVLDLGSGIASQRLEDETGQPAHGLPRGDEDLEKAGIHIGGLGDAGEMLDDQAKAAYRRRLSELREELEEAKELGEVERAEQAEQEIDALTRELSRAVGLGGRNRRAASASERARQTITKTIKAVVERIAQSDAALGRHPVAMRQDGYLLLLSAGPRFPDCVGIRGDGFRYTHRPNRAAARLKWRCRSSTYRSSADSAGDAGCFAVLNGGPNRVCGAGI